MTPHSDTLQKIISLLAHQNKLLEQSQKVNTFDEFNKNVTFPFILSIISATVFWLVFSYWPAHRRKRRLRPKVELDMYHIYQVLFRIFDLAMKPNNHSPSSYQDKIVGNLMTRDLFEMGLRNKCKNPLYFYYPELAPVQICIGQKLYEDSKELDETIERIFRFSDCLSVSEVLLIERIRKKIQAYPLANYAEDPTTVIGQQVFRPLNNSMSYLATNLSELYKLFQEYRLVIFACELEDAAILNFKIQYHYQAGHYRVVQRLAQERIHKAAASGLFRSYLFLATYQSTDHHAAYNQLKERLADKPALVYERYWLKPILEDRTAMAIVKNNYNDQEVEELRNSIHEEQEQMDEFVNNSAAIRMFFDSRDIRR